MKPQPFLRTFVFPAALCALGFVLAMATVLQYSLRAYVPGSLEAGELTFENFSALLKPLYARVFIDTVRICFLTAVCTLLVAYPIAYALVHAQNRLIKAAILIHHGALDKNLSGAYPAQEAELKKNNIRYEGHIYPDSVHGFFNDATPERYNKAAAEQAWKRTIEWFNQYVRADKA